MSQPSLSRRQLLQRLGLAVSLAPLAVSVRRAEAAPLLSAAAPEAKERSSLVPRLDRLA